MKAYYLTAFDTSDKAFEVREVDLPSPGSGQVLIRVAAFGLNFADVMARQGLYRECPPLPCVLGYDVEGEIVKVGEDVSGLAVGDKVFALTRFGGYAEYAVANAEVVGHLAPDAPLGMGCALAVQGVTACHAAVHMQTLLPGEKVLVHAAAGGLGTCLLQLAQHFGCITIGVAGGKAKADYLRGMGIDHVIDHHETDYVEYVKDHLRGSVDVIFDNVGGKSIPLGKKILAPGGRLICLGAAALSGKKGKLSLVRLVLGFGFFSPISYLGKSQSLIGINMLRLGDHRPDIVARGFKHAQAFYAQHILKPHLGNVFHHTALAEAHDLLEHRKAMGKIVMKW